MGKIYRNGVEYGGGTPIVPIASANTLGAIKVGRGLSIDPISGVLNRDNTPITYTALGDVKQVIMERVNNTIELRWADPNDIEDNGGYLAQWDATVLVRKENSAPANVEDGTVVTINTIKNQYLNTAFVDSQVDLTKTTTYYYRFFPRTTTNFYTKSVIRSYNTVSERYRFRINQSVSDPSNRVEYLGDNASYTPASVNLSTGAFNLGSWGDAFFVKEIVPVMLKTNGKEDYKLDVNNFALKANGDNSDISNTAYDGNAMMRIPKIYTKAYIDGDYIYVDISNQAETVDDKCWAHHDENGNEIPYLYMPIYNGFVVDSKMRSLSGVAPTVNTADTTLITYCNNNNSANSHIWSPLTFSAWELMSLLMVLLSKSTNIQTAFGYGNISRNALISSGGANDKGLFYGTSTSDVVKIFGMENFYGNCWKRVVGLGNQNGVGKYKLTYGQEDGSTADGYSQTMDGYKSANYTFPVATSSPIITMALSDGILLPKTAGGSTSTYYCDALTTNNGGNRIAICGGACDNGYIAGPFMFALDNAIGLSYKYLGTGIECRPILGEESIIP